MDSSETYHIEKAVPADDYGIRIAAMPDELAKLIADLPEGSKPLSAMGLLMARLPNVDREEEGTDYWCNAVGLDVASALLLALVLDEFLEHQEQVGLILELRDILDEFADAAREALAMTAEAAL